MKRGRPATTGLDNAIRIARERGCVMKICSGPDSVCAFFIRTADAVIFVCIRRTEKIVAPVPAIAYECRDLIADLRLFPNSLPVRLEVWVYSKHATYRFFRVGDDGLEEISRNGRVPESAAVATAIPGETIPGGKDTGSTGTRPPAA